MELLFKSTHAEDSKKALMYRLSRFLAFLRRQARAIERQHLITSTNLGSARLLEAE
jgi:hypothetical protein